MSTHRTKLLCYADNALVFVHNTHDLLRLETHMPNYCLATLPNSIMTKCKHFLYQDVVTLGANGTDICLPQKSLTYTQSKTKILLPTLDTLSFKNRIQRMQFMASLITKLKTAVEIRSTRSLSVVGKAVVSTGTYYVFYLLLICLVPGILRESSNKTSFINI